MAEGIAFDLVTGVLGKLGAALGNEIGLLWSFKDDADDLRSNFSVIQAVLLDAEEKSFVEKETHALCDWLRKLKDAAYDADDLLDEIRTQALLRKQQRELQNQNQLAKMVCDRFLSCANPINLMFKRKMAHRMKELRANINKITKQMHDFHLDKAGPSQQTEMKDGSDDRETDSYVEKEKIVGRDDDKEEIVKLLLETNGDHDLSVIPIVGMGGLGKTTLARLAFNDGRVTAQQVFDLRVWVYVSTDFDIKKIAEAVKSTTSGEGDLTTKESSKSFLLNTFSQKKFLLVLDDVWNEEQDKWDDLKVLFKAGKKGSKILVTTRKEKVAEIMKTTEQPHRLKGLSDDDCWTLFKRRAFKEGEENSYPSLVEIGKQMVNKCGGVPLAAKALGSMMRSKSRTDVTWSAMRDSEIWRLEENEKDSSKKKEEKILPSLKLSYIQMLSSALKHCFAYCSIFPKGYEFDKDDLIQQWIALGFISSPDTSTLMEDIGNEYFNELLWGYFLQEVEDSQEFNGKVTYRMHDLMHNLARSVARDEVAVRVEEESTGIPEGCRYASIYSYFVSQVPTTVMLRLRALRFRESALPMIFYSAAKCLRLLDLQNSEISVLPSSIGKLKLLRYLNLSSTSIQELPESITGLCNLQTLNLSFCQGIHTLPKFLGRLANLRILNLSMCSRLLSLPSSSSDLQQLEKLDISECEQLCELPKMIEKLTKLKELLNKNCLELKAMPRGIGKLVSLRELSVFVIGKQDRVEHCASISELEHLKLVGELEIKGLENVTNPVDAKAANLIEKNLQSLKLKWNVLSAAEDMDIAQPAEEIDVVLENLQPHQNLAKLVIKGYVGGKFPSWMMNRIDLCLPNLVKIKLVNMPRCSSLPPLGLLPVLEELIIGDMPAITNLSLEFYGDSHINESANKFPALRRLDLSDMPVLREWVTQRRNKFPSLVELSLKRMPVLPEWVPVDDEEGRRERVPIFPCLTQLTLEKCPQLRPEPCLPASVKSLRSLTSLQSLTIRNLADLEIIEDWLGELTELQSLDIDGCSSLRYLPVHKMTTLTELYIKDCSLLFNAGGDVRVNKRPEPCLPTSVRNLTITGMSKEFLLLILKRPTMDSETPPDDGDTVSLQLPNRGLRGLKIEKCQQLTCLPEELRSLTSLEILIIWDCGDLERIEDWLGELNKLWVLDIRDCQSLRYLPAHKMTTLEHLFINDCPLLFNADGQFVDTNVDHIEYVEVNEREYKYKKQMNSLPQEDESSPKGKVSSLKEEKKSWTRCWR